MLGFCFFFTPWIRKPTPDSKTRERQTGFLKGFLVTWTNTSSSTGTVSVEKWFDCEQVLFYCPADALNTLKSIQRQTEEGRRKNTKHVPRVVYNPVQYFCKWAGGIYWNNNSTSMTQMLHPHSAEMNICNTEHNWEVQHLDIPEK